MKKPTKREIEREAARIHQCPKGYEGPCWGPTDADREEAKRRLLAESAGMEA